MKNFVNENIDSFLNESKSKKKPKIRLVYIGEFEPHEVIVELEKVLEYTKRFKVIVLDWAE